MKKLAFVFLITLLSLSITNPKIMSAETKKDTNIYAVKKGETLYKIAYKFGVSELELKKVNGMGKNKVQPGKQMIIPDSINNKERDLLARLVHAEAKGEPFEGKVAVASVVLNRVDHQQFPNTVEKVIKQDGQFEPVENGAINEPAGKQDRMAVQKALALADLDDGSLFFYNPETADNHWQKTRKVTKIIGNHHFSM